MLKGKQRTKKNRKYQFQAKAYRENSQRRLHLTGKEEEEILQRKRRRRRAKGMADDPDHRNPENARDKGSMLLSWFGKGNKEQRTKISASG